MQEHADHVVVDVVREQGHFGRVSNIVLMHLRESSPSVCLSFTLQEHADQVVVDVARERGHFGRVRNTVLMYRYRKQSVCLLVLYRARTC